MIICRGTNVTDGQLFTSLFRDKLSLQGARILLRDGWNPQGSYEPTTKKCQVHQNPFRRMPRSGGAARKENERHLRQDLRHAWDKFQQPSWTISQTVQTWTQVHHGTRWDRQQCDHGGTKLNHAKMQKWYERMMSLFSNSKQQTFTHRNTYSTTKYPKTWNSTSKRNTNSNWKWFRWDVINAMQPK